MLITIILRSVLLISVGAHSLAMEVALGMPVQEFLADSFMGAVRENHVEKLTDIVLRCEPRTILKDILDSILEKYPLLGGRLVEKKFERIDNSGDLIKNALRIISIEVRELSLGEIVLSQYSGIEQEAIVALQDAMRRMLEKLEALKGRVNEINKMAEVLRFFQNPFNYPNVVQVVILVNMIIGNLCFIPNTTTIGIALFILAIVILVGAPISAWLGTFFQKKMLLRYEASNLNLFIEGIRIIDLVFGKMEARMKARKSHMALESEDSASSVESV